jgi:trk system potassium uptake protein TrkH
MTLSSVELSPLAKDNFKYRTQKLIRILLYVYVGMTLAETVLLRVAGMNWFDAVNHSFSTIATGGFSTRNLSIGAYDSLFIESVITFFTFLSGLHFGLIFATLIGGHRNIFRSEVARYYLISILAGAAIMAVSLWNSGIYDSFGTSVRHGVFQAVSIITTTGFATADTTLWTSLAMMILFLFTLQGACAGSTSGGLKSDRILLAFKVIRARVRQQQHPNAVMRIKLHGVAQEESTINFAMLYIVIYIMIVLFGTIVNTAAGADFVTGLSSAASCMSNVGPGFGEVGSLSNFAAIPDVSKLSSALLMLFGRLEIFGLIQLFIVKWWI